MPKLPLRDIPAEISAMREFDGSSMSGRVYSPRGGAYVDPGRLAGPDHERFIKDRSKIIYIVFSYATPIAWVTRGRDPYIVEQYFSPTTASKHMPQVLRAWGEFVPEEHRLAKQAHRQRPSHMPTRRYTIYPSTEGTLRSTPVTAMANPSHIVAGGEYPWDAIKRENAEREVQQPLIDRIAALIGE